MPLPETAHTDWPFDDWLKLAVGRFGLSPAAFWQMSVRDWRTLIAQNSKPAMTRIDFDALLQNFPDQEIKHNE